MGEKIKVPKFIKELGFHTTAEKSKQMGGIRSKNTKPEMALRKELWKTGIRYRKNVKELPGTPDIVIRKKKLAIFVDGEFWHGYNWHEKKDKIKTNRGFWVPKIERNMQKDLENEAALNNLGFKVIRFWEHEIKQHPSKCVSEILQFLFGAEDCYPD